MPSARPKLVDKTGEPVKSDDVATKKADNLYVIGGGGGSPAASSSNLNSSRSSLSMHVSASAGLDFSSAMNESSNRGSGGRRGSATGGRRGSATGGNKKGGSSLARAAKGTFIQDKKPKNKQAVQTSFVVGGGPSSAHQDEKKMEMEDTSARGSSRKGRTSSVISTSFQIPDNGNASFSGLQQGESMDVDGSFRGSSGGRRRSSRTSTVQPTAFVIGGSPPPPQPAQAEAEEGSESMDTTPTSPTTTKTTFVVQPANDATDDNREVEKMEGVIDLSEKPPLCVLDGANLAYAYGKAKPGVSSLEAEAQKPEPDTKGIEVACDYFESAGIRVLAVLPQNWTNRENHQKVLKKLEERGVLVEAPSRDDDDAYAITIARREDAKARQRGDGPGYVMSNDMFRDAAARAKEEGGGDELKDWLSEGSTLDSGKTGPGRISFAFLDTGSLDDHGDKILDLMPNPRHPLIQFVERTRAAAGH